MSEAGIIKSIETDNREWNNLYEQRNKTTQQQKEKRENFVNRMNKRFWPINTKYERKLAKS